MNFCLKVMLAVWGRRRTAQTACFDEEKAMERGRDILTCSS